MVPPPTRRRYRRDDIESGVPRHEPSAEVAGTVPNKVVLALTVMAACWFMHLIPFEAVIPGANAFVINQDAHAITNLPSRRTAAALIPTEEPTIDFGSGDFTIYQINGDGTTQTVGAGEVPLQDTSASDGQASEVEPESDWTTVCMVSHPGTAHNHNHISIVETEPATTEYVTEVVVQTDIATITITDEDDPNWTDGPVPTEEDWQTVVILTHTGAWIYTNVSDELPHEHLATWTPTPSDIVTEGNPQDGEPGPTDINGSHGDGDVSGEAWNEHTRTHPHDVSQDARPTGFVPAHTHQHTFTVMTTLTSTITSANDVIHTELVSAKTITL